MNEPPSTAVALGKRVRVLHFVTGGFSGGATQVAIALVNAALAGPRVEPLLVLRRKWRTDPARIAQLREQDVPLATVAGFPHALTVFSLLRICRKFRPDVLVAHGFSEHLWGRYAGLLARVPVLVHVEHNTHERYTAWRLAQARWLARRTACIVGCSEGVRRRLLELGFPPARTIAIPNGIRLEPFADLDAHPFAQRVAGIVMVARFSRQKDHATLLRAIALLRDRNLVPPVLLCGGGKRRSAMETLSVELGVAGQVQFLGVCRDVPGLLLRHQLAVLATHHEGMPLALLEGMAAGCAVVGSDVQGVREVIGEGVNGRLVPPRDPLALADVLEALLRAPVHAARLGAAARQTALQQHGREQMNDRYEDLFVRLAGEYRHANNARA